MTTDDTRDTGIPTRAIHEAYLGMQQAHRDFRRASDDQQRDDSRAHATYQEAVLTLYELVRPHLKRKTGLQQFWNGDLPEYPDRWWQSIDEAREYCQQYGTAVWALQKHVQTAATSPNVGGDTVAATDGGGTPADWHQRLNLTDRQRVVAVDADSDPLLWVELRATAGLSCLDTWETSQRQRRASGDGFMSGKTSTTVELEYVAPWKLTQAKRLLAEAIDKMSLLSHVDVDHEDGAIVNFDQSREDAQATYRDTEYNGSPDI